MPLFSNKTKTQMLRVFRPDGARFVDHQGEIYKGFGKYANATAACIEVAVKDALYKFYREFREQPQGQYVVEVNVKDDIINVKVIEVNKS